jgi:hypothetical protein
MSERPPFLQRIAELLNTGLGTKGQKLPAWNAALEIDAAPTSPAADSIRVMFATWVERCGYMEPEHHGEYLPKTMWDITPSGQLFVGGKRVSEEDRQTWRRARIGRCAQALREGWPHEEARTFIVSYEEWTEAIGKSRMVAA